MECSVFAVTPGHRQEEDTMANTPLHTEVVRFPGQAGELTGYLAAGNETETPCPGVVIVHENQGLTEHIQDVARRLAEEGFTVLALDALSEYGGTPADRDAAIEQIKQLNDTSVIANYQSAVDFLKSHPLTTGKVGSVGFCWGGRVSGLLAVHSDNLDAAVIYYGKSPATELVAQIHCPMLMHYGEKDDNINATVPAFQSALDEQKKEYTLYMHEGAGHAFNNDTRADRFHAGAAAESWLQTLSFLRKALAL